MVDVRRAARAALALVIALAFGGTALFPPSSIPLVLAADVAWPPSMLVVAEIQTGGGSASDEFVEIANQGPGPVDLIGLEVVYATSSGSTVTRKAAWSDSLVLGSGRRVLLVNGAGVYSSIGDVVYSGGFAATGGAVVLRVIGGAVVDSVGWGDATNTFVEGLAATAPPAGSSLERRPGGLAGNGVDTNDNATDWVLATPDPQSMSSPPVPDPGVEPTPDPTPTVAPTPDPTPDPTPHPTPDPTPQPTPSVDPTPEPTPDPTATPTPVTAISVARGLPDGVTVVLEGVLTTDLGALESGRTGFIQDGTAGIAMYLDAAVVVPLPAGTRVIVRGTLDERYAQRTVRVAEQAIEVTGTPGLPGPTQIATGGVGEAWEGTYVRVSGTLLGPSDALADGTAISVDDGTGSARIVVAPGALDGRTLAAGMTVQAAGALGQRDSSGTGSSGYRIHVMRIADLTLTAPPSPSPNPAPTTGPTPAPTATPTAAPTATPEPPPSSGPSASPSPTPPAGSTPIGTARMLAVGTIVTVTGVVTAEAGRLGTPPLFAIADGSGGIVVRVPEGGAAPSRGARVTVRGALAAPYGQSELRPRADGLTLQGTAPLPDPIPIGGSGLGEATEARLARVTGTVITKPSKSTSGDIWVDVEVAGGIRVRVMADASSGLSANALTKGATYRLTGVVGQRASKKGALDGYRLWLRDPADRSLVAGPSSPSTKPTASTPSGSASATLAVVPISAALGVTSRDVAVEAVVTAGAALLDASGRRIVVQDATAAIEVLLPKDASAPAIGSRVRVVGRVGSAYGAPRLRATAIDVRPGTAVPAPLEVRAALNEHHAWRLVAVAGRVQDVKKLGARWRAEVLVGAARLVVVGQPGAGIPVGAIAEGASVRVTGIVRPAHPTAADRRPSLLPRSSADIEGGGSSAGAITGTAAGAHAPGATAPGGTSASGTVAGGTLSGVPNADFEDLAAFDGQTVRVGGLVTDLTPDGFRVDDGTAVGRIVMEDAAADLLPLVEPADAINVIGRVERFDDGALGVVVRDAGGVALGSELSTASGPGPLPGASVLAAGSSSPAKGDSGITALAAGLGDDLATLPGAGAGVLSIVAIGVASVLVTMLRRRHARRLLAGRVTTRLAAFVGAPQATEPDERDPSVGHAR